MPPTPLLTLTVAFSFLLPARSAAPSAAPSFSYVAASEIESLVANSTAFFVLFFNQTDGATEDTHRVFVEAQRLLSSQFSLPIGVFFLAGPLRDKLERQLRVFERPKFKFFQSGRQPVNYEGRVNKAHIAVWVRKQLRERPADSLPLGSFEELKDLLAGDSRAFAVFFGDPASRAFRAYNSALRLQGLRLYHTTNCFLYKYLTLIELAADQGLVSANFNATLRELPKSQFEALVALKVQEADPRRARCQSMAFLVRKAKFADLTAAFVASESDPSDLRAALAATEQPFLENSYQVKRTVQTASKDTKIAALLIHKDKARAVAGRLKGLRGTAESPVAVVAVSDIVEAVQKEIFGTNEESVMLLEVRRNRVARRFREPVDWNRPFEDQLAALRAREAAGGLTPFSVSKEPSRIAFSDSLFTEIPIADFEARVSGRQSMVVFGNPASSEISEFVEIVKKYAFLVSEVGFFVVDAAENETGAFVDGSSLPFVRFYFNGPNGETRGMRVTSNEGAYEAFLKEVILNSEL